MKLGIRILVCFLLIFVGAFYYLTRGFMNDIRFRYLEGVEDVLVDQARILATVVSQDMAADGTKIERLHRIFDTVNASKFSARIYELTKTDVDVRVYVTDDNGIVVFDSRGDAAIGDDYFRWRDVNFTLKGKYGARSTHDDPSKPASTTLYVAAPIMVNNTIAGVLTVGKPTTNINNFLEIAKAKVLWKSVLAGLWVVLLSTALMFVIFRPIKLLKRYADDIREGKKAVLPKLDRSEIGEMGRAFEKMRDALEGKKYVENYIQTLTHEIKSPISAIQGAAELLEEDMSRDQRAQFLTNIRNETERIRELADRMLRLSSLESMNDLETSEPIRFDNLLQKVISRFTPMIEQQRLDLLASVDEDVRIHGDSLLIEQAISNLIQNAIDFSPEHGRLSISLTKETERAVLLVEDQGPGIPDYAMDRIFEKFFSLRRPVNGDKSTGLGLNFVRNIAELHSGSVHLENRSPNGVRAVLALPIQPE